MRSTNSLFLIVIIGLMIGCTVTRRLEEKQLTSELKHVPREVVQEQQKQLSQEMYERFENNEKRGDSTAIGVSGKSIFDKANFKKDGKGDLVASIDADEVTVVSRTRVLAERDGKVVVDFVITMPRELQSAASSIVITPMLHRSDTTLELEPLQVRGGLFGLLQERSYWKYSVVRDRMMKVRNGILTPEDTMVLKQIFEETVKYPYLDNTRFDSVANAREKITYYYTQQIDVKDAERKLLLTLSGKVNALDGSIYRIPPRDTISFNLSTMLFFVDTTTRYVKKVIERYSVVNDRNYLSFKIGKSNIIDTLGDNANQLGKIKNMMDQMLIQQDYYIDTIVLTAAASPEGYAIKNAVLARERAKSLEKYLKDYYKLPDLDTLLQVRSIGENWNELRKLINLDPNIVEVDGILEIIDNENNLDKREAQIKRKFGKEYDYIRKEIYPQLRTVDFRYNLRRIGMIKDTIHTTVVDTAYMNALEHLKERRYKEAGKVLLGYDDYNGLITALSLGYNEDAYEKAVKMGEMIDDDRMWYMRAIACARVGKFDEGLKYYKKAAQANEGWEFRGRLDPEISMLLYRDQ